MSDNVDLVSAAFVAAQAEFPVAAFDSTNPFFRSRYASFASVLEASQPILAKHGLAVLRKPSVVVEGDKLWTVVETEIVHKSGQRISAGMVKLPLEAEKGRSLVQSWAAQVSYCGRYAWTTPLGIASEEDTDGEPDRPQARSVPKSAPTSPPAPADAPKSDSDAGKGVPKATPAFRMRALNKLQAAPGQPNRPLIAHFLEVKGWIGREDQPEAWPLEHVPATQEQFSTLLEEIQRFEQQQQPNAVSGEEQK